MIWVYLKNYWTAWQEIRLKIKFIHHLLWAMKTYTGNKSWQTRQCLFQVALTSGTLIFQTIACPVLSLAWEEQINPLLLVAPLIKAAFVCAWDTAALSLLPWKAKHMGNQNRARELARKMGFLRAILHLPKNSKQVFFFFSCRDNRVQRTCGLLTHWYIL